MGMTMTEITETLQSNTEKMIHTMEVSAENNETVIQSVKQEIIQQTRIIKDELFEKTVGLAKSNDIHLLHRNVLQSNKDNLTILTSCFNDIKNMNEDTQETLNNNTEKLSTQTERINDLLNETHNLTNEARQTKRELTDANALLKDELLLTTSNLLNKGNYNLENKIGIQIAARDGWVVNQIATPIGSLDKAVTINTQIQLQMIEEQSNTKKQIIDELKDSTDNIISRITPPDSGQMERIEEGLITLIHRNNSTQDEILGQLSNMNERMNDMIRSTEEQHQSTPPSVPLNESGRNLTPNNAPPFYDLYEDDLETKIIKAVIKSEDGTHLGRLLAQIDVSTSYVKEYDPDAHHRNIIQAMISQLYFPRTYGHICWNCNEEFNFQDYKLFFQHLVSCGMTICNCEYLSVLSIYGDVSLDNAILNRELIYHHSHIWRKWRCPYINCGKFFNNELILNQHIELYHQNYPYIDTYSGIWRYLKRNLTSVHNRECLEPSHLIPHNPVFKCKKGKCNAIYDIFEPHAHGNKKRGVGEDVVITKDEHEERYGMMMAGVFQKQSST
jgi:hypothetical protein